MKSWVQDNQHIIPFPIHNDHVVQELDNGNIVDQDNGHQNKDFLPAIGQ